MAFHFDFSEVKPGPDGEEVYTDPKDSMQWSLPAQYINQTSLVCGFAEITEENLQDVTERILVWQRMNGPAFRFMGGVKMYITAADVKLFVGYRSNATRCTKTKFIYNMYDMLKSEQFDGFDREGSAWKQMKEMQ